MQAEELRKIVRSSGTAPLPMEMERVEIGKPPYLLPVSQYGCTCLSLRGAHTWVLFTCLLRAKRTGARFNTRTFVLWPWRRRDVAHAAIATPAVQHHSLAHATCRVSVLGLGVG